MVAKVLVIDDEADLVRLVRYNLEQEGYEVSVAYTGQEALETAWASPPDVVVLDLMLPDMPGLKLCQELKTQLRKQHGQSPRIIMLTARAAEPDRIAGFEAGADDYVTKPFSPRELVLRVKAMLDRQSKGTTQQGDRLNVDRLSMDLKAYRAWAGHEELKLTKLEFKILLTLARHPNVVKTREQLLLDVWANEATEILDRTVDAHVKRLRSKLGVARESLETVRGVGYRFTVNQPVAVSPH